MILCVLKRILLVLWKHFRTPCRKKCLITDRNLGQSFYVVGVQFLCFWVTLGIASRSPFGIFAIGGASDELQFHACSDTCTRARIDVLDGIFQYFIGIQFFGGSAERIINLRLDQPFQKYLIKTDFPCMVFWISMPLIAAVLVYIVVLVLNWLLNLEF